MPYYSDDLINHFVYEAYDLYSVNNLISMDSTNSFVTAYQTTPLLDTYISSKANNDWTIDQANSVNTCATYYCTFTCSMYRPFTTNDSIADVQYATGTNY